VTGELSLDAARALEAETIARAARVSPTPGGRQWAVLVAVLRLTAGWRKAADWLTVATIARLAFGLAPGAHVTQAQWRDTTDALRVWTRRGVIRSKPPQGRPALERRRWWVAIDLDAQRAPTPGALAPLGRPDLGRASDVQHARTRRETRPDPGRAMRARTPGVTPRSKRSQDLSPSREGDARGLTSDPSSNGAHPPEETDPLVDRFARLVTGPPAKIEPGEIAGAVARLIADWGHDALEQWLDDEPVPRRWPRELEEVADAELNVAHWPARRPGPELGRPPPAADVCPTCKGAPPRARALHRPLARHPPHHRGDPAMTDTAPAPTVTIDAETLAAFAQSHARRLGYDPPPDELERVERVFHLLRAVDFELAISVAGESVELVRALAEHHPERDHLVSNRPHRHHGRTMPRPDRSGNRSRIPASAAFLPDETDDLCIFCRLAELVDHLRGVAIPGSRDLTYGEETEAHRLTNQIGDATAALVKLLGDGHP
jgi:hypothetical protein